MSVCKRCKSVTVIKSGWIKTGKQRFKCKECGYQYTEGEKLKPIRGEKIELIDRLSLAGIARAAGVSETWLQSYVNKKIERGEKGFRGRSRGGTGGSGYESSGRK